MKENNIQKLKYPIGEFQTTNPISRNDIETWIKILEHFPQQLTETIKLLDEGELNYAYRPDGWTIKQVVHHLADSHMNSIIRFKLAKTEDLPTIKPYYEDRWANLKDYEQPIDTALLILKGVHEKLGILLKSFSEEDLKRQFIHPEHGKRFSIEETIGLYAWHSQHHLAHIKQALHYQGNF